MTDPGERYARKFKILLRLYPRPDGEQWKGSEIERSSGGKVSSPYVSALRLGKNKRPGMDKLQVIADVMGFPFELWLKDSEELERVDNTRYVNVDPGSFADRLNHLFSTIANEKTGEPFSNAEVAHRSEGRLDEYQIALMRAGETENPGRTELLAFCDVFDIDFSYWDDRVDYRAPLTDPETVAALTEASQVAVRHKARRGVDPSEEDLVSILRDVLKERARRERRNH